MKVKQVFFAALTVFLVLVINSDLQAVNTARIDKVRSKGVLEPEDLQIIDDFVAQAVGELVKTKDFTSIAKVRTVILARDNSSKDSAAAQYTEQFSESAHKYISDALKEARTLTPQERRFKTTLNLLTLVHGLGNPRLANLVMEQLNDESMVIRYWAVHCLANPAITEQLNLLKPADLKLAEAIVEQLKKLVEGACPEILALIVKFTAELNIAQVDDLLGQIADMRIKKYADWTVDYELLDAAVLKLLCDKIYSAAPNKKSAVGRRFGQLYSYAIQRYVKGQNLLSDTQKHQLASVLVETEKSCVSRILRPQSTIRKAVEQNDTIALLAEHNRLLGNQTSPGRLPQKLKFDYGQAPDNSKRIAPLALPQPPKNIPAIK